MQDRSANEDPGDLNSYTDIPQWQEIFDIPIGHPQQENQMPITQTSSQVNLRVDQLQPQQLHQSSLSLPTCVFSSTSELPSTEQNQISFQNQLPVYPATNQLHDQHLQQRLPQNNLPGIQPYDFSPSTIQYQLPVYSVANQLHDQNLQQQLEQTNLPIIQPDEFSPSSQCVSTIHYQSNLQRNIMPHIPIDPQLRSKQTSFFLPQRALSSTNTLGASLAAKHQNQEHIQRHIYNLQSRHQAPLHRAPLLLPKSSVHGRNPLGQFRKIVGETSAFKKNFTWRMANADPEQKKKLKEMRELINSLRISRIKLDLSQTDFSLEMSKQMEIQITLSDIKRLEEFKMHLNKMWTFKPLIERWLEKKVRLGKEQPRITSESSVKPENSSDLSRETQATIFTTSAQVLEDDIRQKKEHGTEDIVILDKSLTTRKENVKSSSEKRFQKEKNLIHNPDD